ncbi:hypothetical protein BCR33DRAFT_716182, partial [Rhizoclosmatium globosum]
MPTNQETVSFFWWMFGNVLYNVFNVLVMTWSFYVTAFETFITFIYVQLLQISTGLLVNYRGYNIFLCLSPKFGQILSPPAYIYLQLAMKQKSTLMDSSSSLSQIVRMSRSNLELNNTRSTSIAEVRIQPK